MAKRTETNVWQSAHCVDCQITWDSLRDDDVAKSAERHADEKRHRVHLREQFAYDVWPGPAPGLPPAPRARPKI